MPAGPASNSHRRTGPNHVLARLVVCATLPAEHGRHGRLPGDGEGEVAPRQGLQVVDPHVALAARVVRGEVRQCAARQHDPGLGRARRGGARARQEVGQRGRGQGELDPAVHLAVDLVGRVHITDLADVVHLLPLVLPAIKHGWLHAFTVALGEAEGLGEAVCRNLQRNILGALGDRGQVVGRGGGARRRRGQGLALAVDLEVGLDGCAGAGQAENEQCLAGGSVLCGGAVADLVREAVAADVDGEPVPVEPAVRRDVKRDTWVGHGGDRAGPDHAGGAGDGARHTCRRQKQQEAAYAPAQSSPPRRPRRRRSAGPCSARISPKNSVSFRAPRGPEERELLTATRKEPLLHPYLLSTISASAALGPISLDCLAGILMVWAIARVLRTPREWFSFGFVSKVTWVIASLWFTWQVGDLVLPFGAIVALSHLPRALTSPRW